MITSGIKMSDMLINSTTTSYSRICGFVPEFLMCRFTIVANDETNVISEIFVCKSWLFE